MMRTYGLRPNWSIGAMEYWSNGLEIDGVRPRAQGARGKHLALRLTPYSRFNAHYSSTPILHMWMTYQSKNLNLMT
jgi:hypothetical protein